MRRIVYLAGLISTDCPESLLWRDAAQSALEAAGFEVRTPLAGKKNLASVTTDGGITSTITTNRAIVLRDRRDVAESDIVLAHLEVFGSSRPLVGTLVELGWAWDDKTPVIAVAKDQNYLMRCHPFISEFVTKYENTVEDAVDFITRYYGGKA